MLKITNENGLQMIVDRYFSRKSAAQKLFETGSNESTKGTIVIAKVTAGELKLGAEIKISSENNHLCDTVVFIERENMPVIIAKAGQSVGVCLRKTNVQELASL